MSGHRITILLIILTSYGWEVVTPESTQNIGKRFTLQDLLSAQNNQVVATDQQTSDTNAKTQTIDIQTLLAAAQRASVRQQQSSTEPSSESSNTNKPINFDIQADKNGNVNMADLQSLLAGGQNQESSNNHNDISSNTDISLSDLQALLSKQNSQQIPASNKVVREEFDLGREKIELEAAGKRATRYALARGADGGLNLVPVIEGAQQTDGNRFQLLQPKGFEEKGSNRQQMQLTTLSQALYSPFPSDQNTLHLHLKGKDGKDGKAGNKGSMGPLGPKGPQGPKGPKGDAGTCSSQINGLFECTPDELDSLSNRVDYLEKICHKVESAAKKHKIHINISKPVPKEESKEHREEQEKVNDKVTASDFSKPKETPEIKPREEMESVKETEKVVKADKVVDNTDETHNERDKSGVNKTSQKEDQTGEKKHMTGYVAPDATEEFERPFERQTFMDPATAALKSMIDVRAKLKISELDLLDRIKQAKEGIMKNL